MSLLKVQAIRRAAIGIKEFELVAPDGAALPPFTAGAHIHVASPNGISRPYSLCGDPRDVYRYRICVLRESHGRGGSKGMHDKVAIGHLLEVSEPKNDFPLDEADRGHCILIAGGIGATPLVAMAHRLHALGRSFEFHYCAHSRDRLVFAGELESLVGAGNLRTYASNGLPQARMDVPQVLARASESSQVYCCGPQSLIEAVRKAWEHRAQERLHYEQFKVEIPEDATAFEVELASSGRVIPVREDESILVALWRAGCPRPFSCEVGICGTCRTSYLSGEPEHRDPLLSEEERKRELLICVSRCRSARLRLDI